MTLDQEILAILKATDKPVTTSELHEKHKLGIDVLQVSQKLYSMRKAGLIVRHEVAKPYAGKNGAQKVYFGYTAAEAPTSPAEQDADEQRMDVIGQNGNTGEHYNAIPELLPALTFESGQNPAPFLSEYNRWLRGASLREHPDPKQLGIAIDEAIACIERLAGEPDACADCQKLHGLEAEIGILLQAGDRHPLQDAFDLAIHQLTKGKGERHGGDIVPFLNQQWVTLADDYGTGFLFGQSNKKLRESMGKSGEARQRELLGALNYLAMGILYEMATKADLLECAGHRFIDKRRATLPQASVPHFAKPRAWAAVRALHGLMLVSTTDERFAVGRGIRLGCELPPGAKTFASRELADSFFDEMKGS